MADAPTIVVVDTSVLINLFHAECLHLLGSLPGFEFVIPSAVTDEITPPAQRAAIDSLIRERRVRSAEVTDMTTLSVFAELRRRLGQGEAACLAIAAGNGWALASDDQGRAFIRELTARLNDDALLTTPGVLLLAIRAGILTVEEADAVKAQLERHRFRMTFSSFRDLV